MTVSWKASAKSTTQRRISCVRSKASECLPRSRSCSRWKIPTASKGAAAWEYTSGLCLPEISREIERSEEHTSELQSRQYLVCRLLLEKKKIKSMCVTLS